MRPPLRPLTRGSVLRALALLVGAAFLYLVYQVVIR